MSSSPPIARLVLIGGRVTGVGFRWHTRHQAENYAGLRGYVRNRDSRTVECLLQGESWMVEEMVECLRRGPAWARVESVRVTALPIDPTLGEFHIAG